MNCALYILKRTVKLFKSTKKINIHVKIADFGRNLQRNGKEINAILHKIQKLQIKIASNEIEKKVVKI